MWLSRILTVTTDPKAKIDNHSEVISSGWSGWFKVSHRKFPIL